MVRTVQEGTNSPQYEQSRVRKVQVPSLGGESRDSSSQLTAKKSYLITDTNFTFNLSVTVRYNWYDSQIYLVLGMVIFDSYNW